MIDSNTWFMLRKHGILSFLVQCQKTLKIAVIHDRKVNFGFTFLRWSTIAYTKPVCSKILLLLTRFEGVGYQALFSVADIDVGSHDAV